MEFLLLAAAFIMAVTALNKISRLNAIVNGLARQVSDLAAAVSRLQQTDQQGAGQKAAEPAKAKTVRKRPELAKAAAAAVAVKAAAVSGPVAAMDAAGRRITKRRFRQNQMPPPQRQSQSLPPRSGRRKPHPPSATWSRRSPRAGWSGSVALPSPLAGFCL
jgi:hypothetical protein